MEFYTSVRCTGNNILYRGYKDGIREQRKIKFQPTTYIGPSPKDYGYRDVAGNPVMPVKHESIMAAKEHAREKHGVSGLNLYGMTRWAYQYLRTLPNHYNPAVIRTLNIDIEVESDDGFPNIETADKPIVSITAEYKNRFFALFLKDYKPHAENIHFIPCANEVELLRKFITLWKKIDPDIVTGWYIKGFDIPYIIHRIDRLHGDKSHMALSPWSFVTGRRFMQNGNVNFEYDIYGVSTLDYIELMKKYEKPLSYYNLGYVGETILGDGKTDYSKYGTLHRLYKENPQLFMEYNIKDVDIVRRLNDNRRLIEQVLAIAYDARVNYEDVLSQVRVWDVIIHNYLLDHKIVVPQIERKEKDSAYEGAYVKEPQIGLHNWVVSFDLTSMYPSLIRQYSIGPDTIIEDQHANFSVEDVLNNTERFQRARARAIEMNASLAANGHFYRKEKSFMAQLMENMMQDRKRYKDEMFRIEKEIEAGPGGDNWYKDHDEWEKWRSSDKVKELRAEMNRCYNLQQAKKIQLNSAYGAMGNQYFRFYDTRHATAITMSGQLSIRWIEQEINGFLNDYFYTKDRDYVIASDTDSVYLDMSEEVRRLTKEDAAPKKDRPEIIDALNKVCGDIIQPAIDVGFKRLAETMNCFENQMIMKREVIAEKGLWQAKKRYVLDVWDSEGVRYASPKLKMMGLETIRSSTPKICREKLTEAIKLVMRADERSVQELVKEFRKEFMALPFEDAASPRSVNGLAQYSDNQNIYRRGAPIHVKAALLHNHLIDKYGLHADYDYIKEGEKIMYCYLKEPNPYKSTAIASIGPLPDEFRLSSHLDYERQFETVFVRPLQSLLDKIGWNAVYRPTLF